MKIGNNFSFYKNIIFFTPSHDNREKRKNISYRLYGIYDAWVYILIIYITHRNVTFSYSYLEIIF